MTNPFAKRATEYLRDSDAFLSIVTPEPLNTFLEGYARDGTLYDRLVLITGTPGSGKTTIATLMQFHFLDSLRRNQDLSGHKALIKSLSACKAIDDDATPLVVGCRLPLEAEYRDFWQLPYSEHTRTRLVLALLQARAVLSWLRNLEVTQQYKPESIKVIARPESAAAANEIGGLLVESLVARASAVELAVYSIGAALVPPTSENDFPEAAKTAYHPFDVIEAFELSTPDGTKRMQPLVMLDDAHTLHPQQLAAVNKNLARRELRIARWVLTRVDVLTPTEALLRSSEGGSQTPQLVRDVTVVAMQKGDRAAHRKAFRRMASDMASRYLRQMPDFSEKGLAKLGDFLQTAPERLADGSMKRLEREVEQTTKALRIPDTRRDALALEIDRYMKGTNSPDNGQDIRLAMLLILLHRYAKRVPQGSLFEDMADVDPAKPIKADSGVLEAARVHLHHGYSRPYYYGFDTVCDAASENAEQFLRLAGALVTKAETKLLRNRPALLDARVQHSALQSEALNILKRYDYPYSVEVGRLADAMADQCVQRSKEPNASLNGGANAIGVPQHEFDKVADTYPGLANVLQFAVAYNVITLAQDYGQGSKTWCLLELGGCVVLKHGLTLQRGGFLERTIAQVAGLLPKEE